jgi:hypothetical protein
MMGPVIVDANLLLLLIVGSCDIQYIGKHKNLSDYNEIDFKILVEAISLFSDVVLLPHIMAEVSSLARQIKNPARSRIQIKLRELVETVPEIHIPSLDGVRRDEFDTFGLTDAVILQMCTMAQNGLGFWLLTADNRLAVQAEMLGYQVLNFLHLQG